MAEKNTISILESIKKKMQNFEKPRKPENSGLAAVGEEFDYITPSAKTDDKKDVAADKKSHNVKKDEASEAAPNKPEDNFLEKELDESFTSFLSKTIGTHKEEKAPEKPPTVQKEELKVAPITPAKNDADDFLSNLKVDDSAIDDIQENSAKQSENKIEAQPLMAQAQIHAEPVADSLQDDSFDFLDDHQEETLVAQPAENKNVEQASAYPKQEAQAQEGADDLNFDFLHDHELHDVAHEMSAPQNQAVNQAVNQPVNQMAQSEKAVNNLPQNNNEFLKQGEQSQVVQENNEVEDFLDKATNQVTQAPQALYNNAPIAPAKQQNYAQPNVVDDYSRFDQGLNQGYNSEMPQRQMPAVPPVRPAGMGNENMLRRKPTSPINPPIFNEAEFLGQNSWDASQPAPKPEEFDEDAFLQEDENKLRQKYQETKEKAPAFSRDNAQMSSNKGVQAVNAVDSILKQQTVAQASDSIKKLMEAKSAVSTVASFAKGDNLNEIALQLLEPKLEKWLNENLPQIVDQIVREEIAKILPKQ